MTERRVDAVDTEDGETQEPGSAPHLAILGCRGIPAGYGGFETFAEVLAPHLAGRGWDVSVYCQTTGSGDITTETRDGVRLVQVPAGKDLGAWSTIRFDWRCMLHSLRQDYDVALVLGYNTAAFWLPYRVLRRGKVVFNMDGLEWKRAKWSPIAKAWLLLNEKAALALSHHFVADHPVIMRRFRRHRRKGSMIPYGSFECDAADVSLLASFGLEPFNYALVLCRIEPENSVLEFVSAFCTRRRDWKLAVVGPFHPDRNDYHARLQAAAGKRDGAVAFLGPVYDKPAVQALRYFARLYLHGHQVGGTNPSLVQALAAGNAAVLHNNAFNRAVAGPKARFFSSAAECAALLDSLLDDEARLVEMGNASLRRFQERFRWEGVLKAYEDLLGSVRDRSS